MALKTFALPYLLCIINLLFFTLVSSHYVPCPPPPPSPKPACPPPPSPKPACPPPSTQPPSHHGGYPTGPPTPTAPKSPPVPKSPPMPKSPPTPMTPKSPPVPKSPPMPKPPPMPKSPPTPAAPPPGSSCPIDVLKLAACANVLTGLADVVLGVPPQSKCCPLLSGLTDLDAAVCLCTALNANILGINLNIPLSLSVLLNYCDKAGEASSFQCPSTTPPTPATPTPPTPTPPTPTPTPVTPTTPPATPPPTSAPPTPTPATPTPPTTPTTPPPGDQCPIDVLKLAACANVLNGLLDAVLGVPPQSQCCPLLDGLADLDAAICLCTALDANLLGINLNVPVSLSLLLNYCNKAGVPAGFQCPSTQTPPTPTPATPTPATPTPATPTPATPTPATPTPATPTPATPTPATPTTATPPTPSGGDNCPIDVLKLGACANVLSGLVDAVLGTPPQSQCCPLLEGLTDLDAAICLCTALKANVLGINLNVPVSLSVLLNSCDKSGAPGFQCS